MSAEADRILVVDDDPDVLVAARLLLKQQGYQVRTETDPQAIPHILKQDAPAVVLLDMNFTQEATSGQEGFYWLQQISELAPTTVVLLITAYGDVEMAVRAIKEGAVDFVLKPWQNEKLLATLSAALALHRSRREAHRLHARQQRLAADLDQPFGDIIGQAPVLKEVFQAVAKVAATDASVLILGENGTGKELVARAIHRRSQRAGEVFIAVDMGSLSETLFESELFGHVKGAFTDARSDRAGRFEIASGGTLFLDEIGNLPLPLQVKLLAALQNQQVVRVGANQPVQVDVRLICATNQPIHEMAAVGTFRQDLLYRINTVEIPLPPLRERPEDIALLARHFLDLYRTKYRKALTDLTAEALAHLRAYAWPGNVRELQHAVERAVIMSEGNRLTASDFPLTAAPSPREEVAFDSYNLEDVEHEVIARVLRKHQGNVSQTARELGLTRTALYRRMEKHGL